MRILSFIFIVYAIVTLAQPCRDLAVSVADATKGTSVAASQRDERSNLDPQNDECSPFCICSCCSMSMLHVRFTFPLPVEVKNGTVEALIPDYSDPNPKTFHDNIWQPPKA